MAELTLFYSYVQDYITGKRIPPSEQKPLSKGVIGVKQFYNAEIATFKGFEFAYSSLVSKKIVFSTNIAYTMGTINKATKTLLDPTTNQVTGETTINNDPLGEIPPLETNVNLAINLLNRKLNIIIGSRIICSQNRVSEAFYEVKTPSTVLFNISGLYKINEKIHISGGIHNIFNEYYYEHLNRRMIGSSDKLYEPGRRFFINIKIIL
jgi:outer membrane receptor protein involved in Fe transport